MSSQPDETPTESSVESPSSASSGPLALYHRIPLYARIVIALLICVILGVTMGKEAGNLKQVSSLMIDLLKALATPLILLAILHAILSARVTGRTARKMVFLLATNTMVAILIGIVVAPLVAWALKRTVLRGPAPIFVMEMPQYRWPGLRSVVTRMLDRAKAFLVRAGTMILASMIVVWALLYFPSTDENGESYDLQIAALQARAEAAIQGSRGLQLEGRQGRLAVRNSERHQPREDRATREDRGHRVRRPGQVHRGAEVACGRRAGLVESPHQRLRVPFGSHEERNSGSCPQSQDSSRSFHGRT